MSSPATTTPTTDPTPPTVHQNPRPTARRRPIVLVEDKMVVTAKVPDRSAPRPLGPTPLQPKRKKTAKPTWQTLLSVAAKNAVLLASLLWLGNFAWMWAHKGQAEQNLQFVASEYEGRIADVEVSLKNAIKALQAQLDGVDKKIGREVGSVKGELAALFEEKRLFLESELNRLQGKTEDLGNALSGLKRMGLLTKGELDKFLNEVENMGSSGGGGVSDVDMDQVMALAKEIVEKEIEKHAADGLGMVDYAVGSGGAKVVKHSEPYVFGKAGGGWIATAMGKGGVHGNAQKMLEPSFGEPGQCFALKGSSGFVEIRLRTGIIPEAVTLEHVSKAVAYDRSSAPKDCTVSGWFDSPDADSSSDSAKVLLTEFTYDLEKRNAQTFNIKAPDVGVINMIRLDFTSNHGSSALTCIYRFRVHGRQPSSPASMASEA